MAAPHIEANRQTDLAVHLNRMLEKAYKDSKCIDLESLCIVVEEKVRFYTDNGLQKICKTSCFVFVRIVYCKESMVFFF